MKTKKQKFSTSTINAQNEIVPWLAAEGALSYSPFSPPQSDYYFRYNYILPNIFKDNINLRCHYWFGDCYFDYDAELINDFWHNARNKELKPIYIKNSSKLMLDFEAPIAVFQIECSKRYKIEPHYLIMQHGSYLIIPTREQPFIQEGALLLHRGIGNINKFNTYQMSKNKTLINSYRKALIESFIDSENSFNSSHGSVRRSQTSHINDSSDYFFKLCKSNGINTSDDLNFIEKVDQCYTLFEDIAKHKFGPSYVTFKTPITNIRICTYFAGEYEVKSLSLDKLIPYNSHGCEFDFITTSAS